MSATPSTSAPTEVLPLTSASRALAAALLGFFIITLDALAVSVALPAIRDDLGGGLVGLQWVMDGYTLPFAAFLLLAGTLSDRSGARDAFGIGLAVFTISSLACALSPSLWVLVAARFVQGVGAAMMTPASLALIGEAYPDPVARSRAVGLWAAGGAVASTAGPLAGGALTTIGWPLIFLINLPIGALALALLWRVPPSRRRASAFDWLSQLLSLGGLAALIVGLIEAGTAGLAPHVLAALLVAAVAAAGFLLRQARSPQPTVPPRLLAPPAAAIPVAIGFTFMIGFYGMVFLMSLLLQGARGLTPLQAGMTFAPVTALSIIMPSLAARLAERRGAWVPIFLGQAAMAAGLFALAAFADTATVPVLVALMVPVGLGAGMAMPSATSLLLNSVPGSWSGVASGVLNTSRQIGGAVAIAAFGALAAGLGSDLGTTVSLAIAGAMLSLTALATLRLRSTP